MALYRNSISCTDYATRINTADTRRNPFNFMQNLPETKPAPPLSSEPEHLMSCSGKPTTSVLHLAKICYHLLLLKPEMYRKYIFKNTEKIIQFVFVKHR